MRLTDAAATMGHHVLPRCGRCLLADYRCKATGQWGLGLIDQVWPAIQDQWEGICLEGPFTSAGPASGTGCKVVARNVMRDRRATTSLVSGRRRTRALHPQGCGPGR